MSGVRDPPPGPLRRRRPQGRRRHASGPRWLEPANRPYLSADSLANRRAAAVSARSISYSSAATCSRFSPVASSASLLIRLLSSSTAVARDDSSATETAIFDSLAQKGAEYDRALPCCSDST